MPKLNTAGTVLAGGLIAATVDIGAACLITGHGIVVILHSIAGGLLGRPAMQGGAGSAVLGLALQQAMGVLIALIYFFAARLMPRLASRWLASGLLFGGAIFAVMNYVVLPLSAWHSTPHFDPASFFENLIAMLLFGLIVAFAQRRHP